MATNKPRLFFVFPGPVYELEHAFGARLEKLSEYFEGVGLTTSSTSSNMRFGSIRITAIRFWDRFNLLFTFRYYIAGLSLALRQRMTGNHIDLVVAYDPLKTGLLGLIVARALRAKLATEVNGDYTSWANYLDIGNKGLRAFKRRIYIATERFILRGADGIKLLYPSQIDYFGTIVNGKVIRVFPNHTELRSFSNLGEEKVVLFAGFPFYLKGVDILILAFKRVASRHPDWKLKILGYFPDTSELDKYMDNHPQISHYPAVDHKEMPEHVGRCAIVVLPSRSEGMGRVLLEAMAAGKPRVGSAVGGIPTIIEDGHDGFLFELENDEQLGRLLDRLMADAELRRRLGQAGQNRVREEFSFARYIDNSRDFYLQTLRT